MPYTVADCVVAKVWAQNPVSLQGLICEIEEQCTVKYKTKYDMMCDLEDALNVLLRRRVISVGVCGVPGDGDPCYLTIDCGEPRQHEIYSEERATVRREEFRAQRGTERQNRVAQ